MAKDKLTDYDATASNNSDVGGVNTAEGMLPSKVNDAIRELMSHQKEAFGSATPLYVDQTSNRVGIGTTSPPQKFVVSNAGADNIVMSENSSASIQMFMQATSGTGSVGTLTNHDVQFLANNSEKMRILPDGKVAIGSTASSEKLRVSGNIEVYNDDVDGYIWFHDTGTRSWSVGSDQSTGNFVVTNVQGIASGQQLSLDGSGNATFSGSVTANGGFVGAGGLLQVVQTTTESEKSTTSTGFVASGIFVDITPSSTSSKILVTTGFTMGTSPNGPPEYKLYRSGTALTNARMSFQADANWNNTTDRGTIEVLDSPNSTASRRYEIYFKRNGTGAARIGRSGDKSHATTSTYITAMEIAG